MKLPGKLYLIPSPIDLTVPDVIPTPTRNVIKGLDYFLVENLRSARRYISSLKLGVGLGELCFEQFDKRTSFEEVMHFISPIVNGRDAGVIAEAGCPGIADPGSLAVRAAHQLNIQVIPLVGPSSIFLALMASGFNGQSFAFHGYLPHNRNERSKRIKHLESVMFKTGQSQIFMETPYRNDALMNTLLKVSHPTTNLCVASGINSANEFIRSCPVALWKKEKVKLNKIPTIFIIGD